MKFFTVGTAGPRTSTLSNVASALQRDGLGGFMGTSKRRVLLSATAGFLVFGIIFPVAGATKADSLGLTSEMAAQLSRNPNRPVIVLLKHSASHEEAQATQEPLDDELRQVGARKI